MLAGCMNEDAKKEATIKRGEEQKTVSKENSVSIQTDFLEKENNEGTFYTDSMIERLSKKTEEIVIDSFLVLHSFNKEKFQSENCSEFTVEILGELDPYGINRDDEKILAYPNVTIAQSKLLGVTEYLCNKTFRDNFDMYIFHSTNMESHYGNSIDLFTISNKTNEFNRLRLSQQYLREGYEYDISSRFLTLNEIEITKEERFNTSNNLSEDDSISFTKTNYLINEAGEIIELK